MTWTRIAALLGLFGVGLGAFGAHGLERVATPEQLEWWDTATLYHLLHVAPLLVLDRLDAGSGRTRFAGAAFLTGVIVFSGTLYAMGLGAPRWLGAITPLGGLSLMIGWLLLFRACGQGGGDSAL